MFQHMHDRQSKRLAQERRAGLPRDLQLLTQEDLIGPDPSKVVLVSAAWRELQQMIGLKSIKTSIRNMISTLQVNYQRELKELPPVQVSLNRLFLGGPSAGKTTVAKLYGRILVDLGSLSNGEGMSLHYITNVD
jgi:hypothetical protein